jgi:toxin ParE1/3/4
MPWVIFTPEADADLAEIGENIALQNPTAARLFLAEIRRRCELRATQPFAADPLNTHRRRTVRRFFAGNYIIYFRPIDDGIEVLRVWHGARGRRPKL